MSSYKQFKVSTQSGSDNRASLMGRRFLNYLISLNFARIESKEGLDTFDQEDDTPAQEREMLAVEQRRHAERQRKSDAHERLTVKMQQVLHTRIYNAIDQRLEDHDYLRDRILMIPPEVPELLDSLYAPATTSKKIEQLGAKLDWLHEGMVRIVNQPPFADPKDIKRVRVTNFRGALNFVGTQDLSIITPALAMQSWLPPAEAPFTLLRRKIWMHSLATGIVAQKIAEIKGLEQPQIAFGLGIFHEMGKIMLARLYLKIFEDVRYDTLKELRNETHSSKYNALLEVKPDQQFLRDLMLQRDALATAKLFEGFNMKRLPLAEHLEAYAKADDATQLRGYPLALYQANIYSEFKILHQANLANLDDGKEMFRQARLSGTIIKELRSVNLKKLNLYRGRVEESSDAAPPNAAEQ